MSLLQKASIITTPTAYAEDYLYSIKPAYALGSELITQFDGVSDGTDVATLAGWSAYNTATSRNIVDEKLVIVASGSNQGAYFQAGTVAGTKYLLTATITGDLGAGGVYVNNINNVSTESGKIEFRFTALVSATFIYFRASNNTAGTTTYADISLKPITDADFDFDRNSTGTRVNEDYLIEDVPYNLYSRSEDFSHGGYGKFQASIADTTIQSPISSSFVQSISSTVSSSSTHSFINQSLSNPDRQVMTTFSVYAKKGTYNRLGLSNRSNDSFGVIYDLDSGTVVNENNGTGQILASSIQSAGNGFYLCSVTLEKSNQYNIHPVPSDVSSASQLRGNSMNYSTLGNILIFGAQAVKGSKLKPYLKTTDRLDIPRIDYTNGEPSILLEPSRTNLVTYSQDLSQWSIVNGTLTANATVSPEGIQNAGKVVFNNVGLDFKRTVTVVAGTTYTISFYIKVEQGTGLQGRFYDNSNSTNIEYYNFDDQIIPNQWSRITRSVTAPSGCTEMQIWLLASSSTLVTASWWGAQFEAGSYATSLIHTSGSAVTRSADSAYNAGNSDLINSTEGVLYVEASSNYDSSHTNRIAISDGTSSNRITLEWDETTENRIRVLINTHSILSYDAVDLSIQNKVAFKYAANDYAIWFNGQEVVTQASGALPTGMDMLELRGVGLGSAGSFYGNVKSVMVYKEALTDLELEKLTGYNNHELYMNYYNRLSYLGLAEEYNVESDINNYIL